MKDIIENRTNASSRKNYGCWTCHTGERSDMDVPHGHLLSCKRHC